MNLRQLLARNARVRDAAYALLRLRARAVREQSGPPVLVNSFPKSGTHVVLSVLEALPGLRNSGVVVTNRDVVACARPDSSPGFALAPRARRRLERMPGDHYAVAHLWARPEIVAAIRRRGFRVVFVVRDPRDTVISTAHYTTRIGRGIHSARYRAMASDRDRYLATIRGYPAGHEGRALEPLDTRLRGYLPWRQAEGVLTLRFEDLVGERGGGSDAAQLAAVRSLTTHLGFELGEAELRTLAASAWSPRSATFRSGRVGGWREELDEEVLAAFAATVPAELMAAYGYEL